MFAPTLPIVNLEFEGALLDYLATTYEKFQAQCITNPASRLAQLSMLHLRGPKRKDAPKGYAYDLSYVDCEDKPSMLQFPEVKALVSYLQGATGLKQVGNVMLSVMHGGAFIEPHFDPGTYFEHYRRIHIPIMTDPACFAYSMTYPIGSKSVRPIIETNMTVGHAWELNNCDYHWFHHKGSSSRYHCVVDLAA